LPIYIDIANVGRSILIFNKMVFIFLGVVIVFTVLSFEFQQVKLPWLHIANDHDDELPSIHPTWVYWTIRFGGNAGVLSQAVSGPYNCNKTAIKQIRVFVLSEAKNCSSGV